MQICLPYTKITPLYCRLPQQVPCHQEDRKSISRLPNNDMQNNFSEHRLPKKIMSDAGGKFISNNFRTFCKNLNME